MGKFNLLAAKLLILCKTMIMCCAFARYSQLSTDSWVGRFLGLMGRRSLDIYFLHYFFLPRDLGYVGTFFDGHGSEVLEWLLALGMGLVLVLMPMGVGALIRLSPMWGKWLLGIRDRKK